jgi:hypothetical protein
MRCLVVEIVRFADEHQPGWVECEFVDANGRKHTVVEKVPIIASEEDLGPRSAYPQPGVIRCEVMRRWTDDQGRELARVSTEQPDWVETIEGASEFEVFASQLV